MIKVFQTVAALSLFFVTSAFSLSVQIIGKNGDLIKYNQYQDLSVDMAKLTDAVIKVKNEGYGIGSNHSSYGRDEQTSITLIQNGQVIGSGQVPGELDIIEIPFPALTSNTPITVSGTYAIVSHPSGYTENYQFSYNIIHTSTGVVLPCGGELNPHKRGISSIGCPFLNVKVGDKIYFTADGPAFAKTITEGNDWWVGFSWNEEEYKGASTSGSLTVIRQ